MDPVVNVSREALSVGQKGEEVAHTRTRLVKEDRWREVDGFETAFGDRADCKDSSDPSFQRHPYLLP